MKVIVKKGFRDKHTKQDYIPNDILEITKTRFKEIQKVADLVEEITEEEFLVEETSETSEEKSAENE